MTIGDWQTATEAGRHEIRSRARARDVRIRHRQEQRALLERTPPDSYLCPNCLVFYPAITFCPECGAVLGPEKLTDEGPRKGRRWEHILALISAILVLPPMLAAPFSFISIYFFIPMLLGLVGFGICGWRSYRRAKGWRRS